jgi:CRP-like cAMP-binding protein
MFRTAPSGRPTRSEIPQRARSIPKQDHQNCSNHILAAMPKKAGQSVLDGVDEVEVTYGQILYEPEGPIRKVYFPIDCLVSLLTAVDARRSLEVGLVGNEGMVGMPMALGIPVSAVCALVQGSGKALTMSAARFRTEFRVNLALQHALFRYNHLLMAQISQTAACNRFHETGPRLARWLLMTADRMGSDEFRLTHEFLAHMLGIRRVGVTRAAGVLEKKKLIAYSRGHIQILKRKGLEAAACSCYRIVKDLQDHTHDR